MLAKKNKNKNSILTGTLNEYRFQETRIEEQIEMLKYMSL